MPDDNTDNLETTDARFSEIFMSDDTELAEEEGLVYKDILREGEWAYRPMNGKPVPIPMRIVPGNAEAATEIGMADIIEAFDEGAVDHVTVPTSHKDAPHENTGFVRKLRKTIRDGKARLQAGIEFTEPGYKEKTQRGTIAGCSSGLLHDYIKKDTGKSFKNVLGHVALTNKPWLNGMEPFGLAAEENFSDDEIDVLLLEDVIWDAESSFNGTRDRVSKAIAAVSPDTYVADVTKNKALVAKFSAEGPLQDQNFVVPFKDKDGEISISDEKKWIKASQEWVKTALAEDEVYQTLRKSFDGDSRTEELSEISAKQGVVSEDIQGGIDMSKESTKKDAEVGAEDNPVTTESNFSEADVQAAVDKKATELSEAIAAKDAEVEELRKRVHTAEVEKNITELSDAGLKNYPGLLAEIRTLKLGDTGATVLNLSEEVDGATVETNLSVSDAVDRIIAALPKDEESGAIKLSEQVLISDSHGAPSEEVSTEEEREAKYEAAQKALGRKVIKKDGDA